MWTESCVCAYDVIQLVQTAPRCPPDWTQELCVCLREFTYFNKGVHVFKTGTQLAFFLVVGVWIGVLKPTVCGDTTPWGSHHLVRCVHVSYRKQLPRRFLRSYSVEAEAEAEAAPPVGVECTSRRNTGRVFQHFLRSYWKCIATSSYVKWSEMCALIISHFFRIFWVFHVDCNHSSNWGPNQNRTWIFLYCMAKLWLSACKLNAVTLQPHLCVGSSVEYCTRVLVPWGGSIDICNLQQVNYNICIVLQGYEGKKYTPITS